MINTRHMRIIIFITFIIILLIISAALIISNSRNKISQKPETPESTEEQQQDDSDPQWYIKFSVKDQRATAYIEESMAPVAANGEDYFIGGAAVHPLYPLNAGGSPLVPTIPFGSTIYLDKPIKIQGNEYTSLQIMDTGDVYYGLWPQYPYWVDIYFGTANYYNQVDANKFGTDQISYYWIEEWR